MPVETIIFDENEPETLNAVIDQRIRSQESPIKILAFDSWTGGAFNYERLLESFKQKGMELTLVHLGSWGADPGRPPQEQIGKLQVKDISAYPRKSFPDILDAEKPGAVIFLSTDTFAHRAFIRYCRQRKVPTLYLFHGVRGIQARDSSTIYKTKFLAQLRFVTDRLFKALRHVWPTYAKALWTTGAAFREWTRFGKDIIVLALGRYVQISADDSRTEACCVYIPAEVEIAEEKYGFEKEQVTVVGNPDLARFGLSRDSIGSKLALSSLDDRDVMYIDSAFIYSGWVFASPRDYLEHLIATKTALESQGRRLVFKPHPDHFKHNFVAVLAENDIEVCLNEDFVPRLKRCCACIVEQSSLALVPALMGMPLLLTSYGKLAGQRFGELITDYPRAKVLIDLTNVNAFLAEEQASFDPEAARHWIHENAGPLPAEEMPDRVAEVVLKLTNRNRD